MKSSFLTIFSTLTLTLAMTFSVQASTAEQIREDWQVLADAISASGNEDAALRISHSMATIPDEQLEKVYGNIDLLQLADTFLDMNEVNRDRQDIVKGFTVMATAPQAYSSGSSKTNSFGFPSAAYPSTSICSLSPNRSDDFRQFTALKAIDATNLALETAQGVWSAASRVCEEVILGFNGSLICIPVDVVLFVAELAVGIAEHIFMLEEHCDSEVNEAEIEGSYERLGHLHGDLQSHDFDITSQIGTHDSTIKSQLTTHDSDLKAALSTHDEDIKAQVTTHDTDIKSQVTEHDTDIKSQLSTHDADVKVLLAQLQGAVDENQRLLKISASRELEILRLLITPQGTREINPDVLTCVGNDCPGVNEVLTCSNGNDWPCK